MTTMEVIAEFFRFVEFVATVAFVLALAGAVVWALGAWMQSNPALSARREQQNRAAMKQKIAAENAQAATRNKRFV